MGSIFLNFCEYNYDIKFIFKWVKVVGPVCHLNLRFRHWWTARWRCATEAGRRRQAVASSWTARQRWPDRGVWRRIETTRRASERRRARAERPDGPMDWPRNLELLRLNQRRSGHRTKCKVGPPNCRPIHSRGTKMQKFLAKYLYLKQAHI